jgi:vacuolar-type H+-ATPase subunit E/Vma4
MYGIVPKPPVWEDIVTDEMQERFDKLTPEKQEELFGEIFSVASERLMDMESSKVEEYFKEIIMECLDKMDGGGNTSNDPWKKGLELLW